MARLRNRFVKLRISRYHLPNEGSFKLKAREGPIFQGRLPQESLYALQRPLNVCILMETIVWNIGSEQVGGVDIWVSYQVDGNPLEDGWVKIAVVTENGYPIPTMQSIRQVKISFIGR